MPLLFLCTWVIDVGVADSSWADADICRRIVMDIGKEAMRCDTGQLNFLFLQPVCLCYDTLVSGIFIIPVLYTIPHQSL